MMERSIGRPIDRSISWMLGPFFRSSGGRFDTLGGSHIDPQTMKNHRESSPNRPKIVPKSTEIHPKPSKIGPWGPPGRPGGPRTKTDGKCWFVGPGPGTRFLTFGRHFHHLADIFSVFGCKVGGLLDDCRFDGKSVRKWTAGCD